MVCSSTPAIFGRNDFRLELVTPLTDAGVIEGHVEQTATEGKLKAQNKGKAAATRNASKDNPAVQVEMDDGREVVKRQSELYKVHD